MATAKALSREKIFEIAKALPPAPRVLTELGELLRDTNTDLPSVAALIKRDTALAAHIIRMANSVVYGGGGETAVGSIEDAVARVGFREVYRLVGMAAVGRLTERPLRFYGVPTGLLRANMLYTALVSEALAEACRMDTRSAYTAGLIRTLGILVLDRVAEILPGVTPYVHEEMGSYAQWEGRHFVFTHCEVAGMILVEWGFPEETIEAVRKHYLLRETDNQYQLACLLNLAGGIAAVAGVSLPGEFNQWESSEERASTLGLSPAAIHRASEKARAAYEGFRPHIEPDTESSQVPQLRTDPIPVPAPPVALQRHSRSPFIPAVHTPCPAVEVTPSAVDVRTSFFEWSLSVRISMVAVSCAAAIALWLLCAHMDRTILPPFVDRCSQVGNTLTRSLGLIATLDTLAGMIPSSVARTAALLLVLLYGAAHALLTLFRRILATRSSP